MSDSPRYRFGAFEMDVVAGELRLRGDVVKLAPQPFKVLAVLVGHAGQVVTRADIREHVWCGDTFVDFEQGLNFCIRQVREALGDTADAPRFIETLPRRGYRFLAPVTTAENAPLSGRVTRLIVLPFRMLRPSPDTEFLAFSLADALSHALSGLGSLVVRSSMAASRFGPDADPKNVGVQADVDVIVTGTLLSAGEDVRVTTQLTDASDGTLRWSHAIQAKAGDVFRVQDELVERIVASLALPLTSREQEMLRRDVPSNPRAYDLFLRGNQLSYDSKQWAVARDLYERAVEEDPAYAPAWARLGRIHHVMSKYLDSGQAEGFDRARAAFTRALDLNPDLPLGHKLQAQLDVDEGRAQDAMLRLAERAGSADPELLAGLVTTCRYCGLLDASAAAHSRAVALEPKIRTSVVHTWFMQGDDVRVSAVKVADFPYIVALSLDAIGRGKESLVTLREQEQIVKTRIRDFIVAARTLLEGDREGSLAAMKNVVAARNFTDPEGLFYVARHLAHLGETTLALEQLERVVAGGFFCYPMLARDAWLAPLRKHARFTALLRETESRHRNAVEAWRRVGGDTVLAVSVAG